MHRPIIQLAEMHIERCPALQGLIHVPNEGKRSKAGHGIMIGLGLRPGASDLLLLRARRGHCGLAMELKAPGVVAAEIRLPGRERHITAEQRTFLKQQAAEGWLACVCDSAEMGWALIAWYVGLPSRVLFSEYELTSKPNLLWAHELQLTRRA